jgi:hypothetical protein
MDFPGNCFYLEDLVKVKINQALSGHNDIGNCMAAKPSALNDIGSFF